MSARRGRAARPVLAALAAWAGALLLLAAPARAQLTFPSAGPVSAGNLIVRTQPTIVDGTGGFQSLYDRNVLLYGASPDLTFILQNNSIVSNSAAVTSGGRTQHLTATGFGDTLFQTRYTIFGVDGIGSTFRVAPVIGIDVPTGMDDANPLMPRGLQPGTGAWGTRDAVAATWQTLTWNGAIEGGYQANAGSGGYQFGNSLYADAGFHYLLWPADLEGDVPAELYASLEANYSSNAANRAGTFDVPGTGGQLLLLDPGLIYTRQSYSFSLVAFLPAYEHVSPNGSRLNYGIALYFRRSFFTPYHW